MIWLFAELQAATNKKKKISDFLKASLVIFLIIEESEENFGDSTLSQVRSIHY